MGLFSKKEKGMPESTASTNDLEKIEREQGIKWEDAPIPIEPLQNRVLILIYDGPERTRSGLYLPKSAQDGGQLHEVMFGRVLKVGPGREHPQDADKKLEVCVKRGDVVAFEKFKGLEFVKEKMRYKVCWDTELIGIMPNYDDEDQYA